MSTIFAVSSGAAPAAIAIMRLSGPSAFDAVRALAGSVPAPRIAALCALRDPADGTLLDRALVLTFPGPRSVTGEDLAELHLHGSRAVIAAVDRVLAAIPGLRRAEAGEFTRRALMSGRLDLTEAEGLGDLLTAETETQRRQALSVAEGSLRRQAEGWTDRVVAAAATVEAGLDFSDEDDVGEGIDATLQDDLAGLHREMSRLYAAPSVERLRDGIRVVIAGPPNAGKSTLLNALTDRDAAIVTPIAGTTRDIIDVPVMRRGIAYLVSDTAGLRAEPADAVEAIGIDRATNAMIGADIVLWLGDDPPPSLFTAGSLLWVHGRADQADRAGMPLGPTISVSASTGEGLERLWGAIEGNAALLLPREGQLALNIRQRAAIGEAIIAVDSAVGVHDPLIVAEGLRLARRALDELAGRADIEALLDSIFGNFCIGK